MSGWPAVAITSLALWALYLALAFGWRMLAQWRSTGTTGFKGLSGRPGSAAGFGGVLFVCALVLGLAAPVLGLAGATGSFGVLDGPVWRALGLALFALGLAGTLWAQGAMGAFWRIGVDEAERTGLVTGGPFVFVRNPIFSAMVAAFSGLALLVPNVAAFAGVAALIAAVELQVRFVEEPYLLGAHGGRYARYASRARRVGRIATRHGVAETGHARNLAEPVAMLAVGDGVMAPVVPRRPSALRGFGPGRYGRAMEAFADRPRPGTWRTRSVSGPGRPCGNTAGGGDPGEEPPISAYPG